MGRVWHMSDSILANVAANLITATIVGGIGLIAYAVLFLVERNRLVRFFGIKRQPLSVRLYLSRLQILPGGTKGFEDLRDGYVGPSISKIEYDGALLIAKSFSSSLIALMPASVRTWMAHRYPRVGTLAPSIDVCPRHLSAVSSGGTVVALGGAVYNAITQHYLKHPQCPFYFDKRADGQRALWRRHVGLRDFEPPTEVPGRALGRELGLVQKLYDSTTDTTVFICAGTGSSATFGCAKYLAQHWRSFLRRHGNGAFALCLAFQDQQPDGEMVVDPIIIEEISCEPRTHLDAPSVVFPESAGT
jgi:hypothetical protein